MNIIFGFVMIVSIIVSFFYGSFDLVINSGGLGAKQGVDFIISIIGAMCMWSGILQIAYDGGVLKLLQKAISPIINVLFPKLKENERAKQQIVANMTANIMGISNAATPSGIKAMEELDKINELPETASDEMGVFTVINTASIQLIPTTIIAMRCSQSSSNPEKIIIPIWISSFTAMICAVVLMKFVNKIRKR